MKLTIQTSVQQSYQQVWAGFTKDLFTKLSPPFPPVKVIRFDGCLKGDVVELELNFLVFKQSWKSLITDQQTTDVDIFFLDEGIKLPFFLSSWRHYHRIIKDSNNTIIADEIEFRTPTILTDYLLYPLLWAQFAYRKPIYRSVFNRKT
jgi:ligand-binding SRPBCC domain-containing protein